MIESFDVSLADSVLRKALEGIHQHPDYDPEDWGRLGPLDESLKIQSVKLRAEGHMVEWMFGPLATGIAGWLATITVAAWDEEWTDRRDQGLRATLVIQAELWDETYSVAWYRDDQGYRWHFQHEGG
jgi:hypothetical protein